MPVKINNFTIQAQASTKLETPRKKGKGDNSYNQKMSQDEIIDTCVEKVMDKLNQKFQDKLD